MIQGIDKVAAILSEEIGSHLNPLNAAGAPLGALAALLTPTRTAEEQSREGPSGVSNLLIPGVGPYNKFKRLGRSASNSPHGYTQTAAELATAALPLGVGGAIAAQPGNDQRTAGGVALAATPLLGAIAALLTDRRTLKEQAAHDNSALGGLSNLIPGAGMYNLLKRYGSTKAYDEAGIAKEKQDVARQARTRQRETE